MFFIRRHVGSAIASPQGHVNTKATSSATSKPKSKLSTKITKKSRRS